ncbi:Winged helix DNA-binding protein [Tenacibaculum sp. 190524A02b]|uniref:Winged helix DNA-binding protein n=1 Tax=Tenacibaculum vairaonense TaxID=3137860 RepID=A0ABP1F533_9FLAO
MDYLKEIEFAGVTARLKRISDTLMHDARRVYEYLNLSIEPNWHLVFLLLKKEKQLAVTEISAKLNFSHPAIINIIKKMKSKGYIISSTDTKDSRRQIIQLSKKAMQELPKLENEWDEIQLVVSQIFDTEFLEKLATVEANISEASMLKRLQLLKEMKK